MMRSRLISLIVPLAVWVGPTAWADAQTVTLTFVRLKSAAHDAYLDPLVAAFEKANPAIKIEAIPVPSGGYEAVAQKALLTAAAGTPPDLLQAGYGLVRTFVESGRVLPLDDLMKADPAFRADSLLPAMLDLGRVDGKVYLVPIGTSTPAMFYNVEAFAKAGLDPQAPPRSWAETRAAAEKLTAAGYEGVLWGWGITGNWIFQAMLEDAGGRMADPSGRTVTFNQAPGVKVGEYLGSLTAAKLMPVTDQNVQVFASGRLGMLVDSSFQRVNLPRQAKFGVRLASMPTVDGRPARVPGGGNGVMIMARDPARVQAAWRFVRFMTEPEASRIVGERTGYTPANQEVVAALRSQYAADANFQVVLADAARVTPWHSWPGSEGTKISRILRDAQHAILLGKKAAKPALDEAAAQVQALLPR